MAARTYRLGLQLTFKAHRGFRADASLVEFLCAHLQPRRGCERAVDHYNISCTRACGRRRQCELRQRFCAIAGSERRTRVPAPGEQVGLRAAVAYCAPSRWCVSQPRSHSRALPRVPASASARLALTLAAIPSSATPSAENKVQVPLGLHLHLRRMCVSVHPLVLY